MIWKCSRGREWGSSRTSLNDSLEAALKKCFEGPGIEAMRARLKYRFGKIINVKPAASRKESKEFYILSQDPIGKSALRLQTRSQVEA